jgi:dipeptidase E
MQMLLLSLGLGALAAHIHAGAKIGFVPTAGETYSDPLNDDRVRLRLLGYEVEEVDISRGNRRGLMAQIAKCAALFVAGGNTFYLLQQIRAAGIEDDLKAEIRAGKMYVGASAGAAVVGPSLDPIRTLDDASAAPGLTTTNGMSLVDFVVLPHYGKEKNLPLYEAIQQEYGEQYKLITLTDQQAIHVSGDGMHTVIDSDLVLHPLPST